jgi:hypothetical protein
LATNNVNFKIKNGLTIETLTTAGVLINDTSGNITSTTTPTITASSASNALAVDTVSISTNASFYPVFVNSNNGTAGSESLYTDAGLIYNPSSNNLSIGGDFAVNGGDITTNQTTFNLINATATTLNIGGEATTLAIGAASSTATFGGTVSADQVFSTNNGNGTNFKVGDDAWIGDINTANTISLRGNQSAANAYVVFGNGDSKALGRAGTGVLTYDSAPVAVGYTYITSALQGVDTATTTASMLNSATLGITIAAGTTYEFEVVAPIQHTYVGSTTATTSFGLTTTTVTGSPTVSYGYQLRYGSNTTGFTTASADNAIWRTTGSQLVGSAISTGSRYIQCHMRGFIRVTGTGTVKVYPAITQSATGNSAYAQAGSFFRLTQIGDGTVTSAGSGWG